MQLLSGRNSTNNAKRELHETDWSQNDHWVTEKSCIQALRVAFI